MGEYLTPEQLFERVLADQPYYASSGGGVTFSGGEPTLYPDFMERILDLCRARDIPAMMETSGFFSYDRWTAILPKLQLIYFDLKIMDDALHRRATGQGNARILDNARRLVADGYPVEFRLALVPGFTDCDENLAAISQFLTALGQQGIHLLSYHPMGEAKIDIICGPQPKLALKSYPRERALQVADWFEQRGIACLCEL